MKNILIISNNAASVSESNGRIHLLQYINYIKGGHIFNYYLNGSPDVNEIKYITFSNRQVFKSKFHLGNVNSLIHYGKPSTQNSNKRSKKSKYAFLHLMRNFCYSKNNQILKELEKFIIINNINHIVLWGCNVPFLYEYASYLSLNNNIELSIYTGEEYPLKRYNYLSKCPSLFFKPLQKRLYKSSFEAYKQSSLNLFATEDLLNAYKKEFLINNFDVVHFSSSLSRIDNKSKSINKIIYAGNLYNDRVNSILEIAEHIQKSPCVDIEIFGHANKSNLNKLKKFKNVFYKGLIPYNELISKLKDADLLLHIEGFSKYYKKDCKFAFSTKISDYFLLNKPFFIYGPKEISGVNFAYQVNSDYVAVSKDELSKLDSILDGSKRYIVDYEYLYENFSTEKNAQKMFALIEKC